MSAIRHFVSLNRTASAWIAMRFPRIFSNPKPSYRETLLDRVNRDISIKKPGTVLEAGGVDRPVLDRSPDYEFVGLDIDERPDCARLYDRFLVQSIEIPLPVKADVIISFTLLEHVPNNTASIRAMYEGLNAGGSTHHYIPCGLHPYSLALRAIGPRLQRRLIPILRPGTEGITGYPAFFDLCTPRAMTQAFRAAGFTEIDVKPFYRANDYFAFFTPAFISVTLFENVCRLLGLSTLASGIVISARKPSSVRTAHDEKSA
ncbi:MAG: class I SAM-dependent methyltransferase [Roseovarius sp.]|uniref:class I SAM-dependent methyltransferase n=1 Tax=Roseovarius sp. TaxID=1486281 RepID=UPI0032ED5758